MTSHIGCAMMHNMNWEDLRILECCVRTGSFAKAAAELGTSHSSISRKMTRLEKELNTTLLYRTPMGVSLTETGKIVATQTGRMAEAALSVKNTNQGNHHLSGCIRFETLDSTAFSIMPYLQEFTDLHPDIEIDLSLNQGLVDLSRGESDVVLRATNTPTEDYIGFHVASHAFAIFGAPKLINQYPPETPLSELPWVLWQGGWTDEWMQKHNLSPRVAMRVNTAYGMNQAIRSGVGIGHLACYGVALDNQFLCLRGPDRGLDLQIWLLAHKSMRSNQKVRAFYDFLKQRITKDKALIQGHVGNPVHSLNRKLTV